MNHEPLFGDGLCPLSRRPLRIEYDRTRPSAQQDYPARVWIAGYRCAGCESVAPAVGRRDARPLRDLTAPCECCATRLTTTATHSSRLHRQPPPTQMPLHRQTAVDVELTHHVPDGLHLTDRC
ncbi:hypothetical protein SBI_01487 [Streptomyces bingchenggensis BCW-1]|uniref:Uncharacterized protein n=1 Tax=Streptomyces bingchenggensis (strain BCW-1) TaxID=749414 RepID=D7CDU3_STRBB|nr:hypothetical protein SBI_01487 [Streptomyces bingchenggensis BCW-1]